MSLFLKVHCEHCGSVAEIYEKDMQHDSFYRCPHCYTKMTAKQWEALVNSFYTTYDMNYQALKSHNEHNTPLFRVEIPYRKVPESKFNFADDEC